MKIAIIGFSGSGKSTLAAKLGELYGLPVFHLDCYHFKPDWIENSDDEMEQKLRFDLNGSESWVIDGNYTRIYPERFTEADLLVFLNFNRFICLYRAIKRKIVYSHKSRPSIAPGCKEKLDLTFIWWILHKGRDRRHKKRLKMLCEQAKKSIIIDRKGKLSKFIRTIELSKKGNSSNVS